MLQPHPSNPRKQVQNDLEELTDSIYETGLIEPLIVRPLGNEYQIISGHRRKAALERVGFLEAECIVKELNDEDALKLLLVTNIQRKSMSEIEEAEGIRRMMDEFGWSQERVADEFGKGQRWVSYRLSLLGLDDSIKEKLSTRVLKPTHAREIAQAPKEVQSEIADKVVEEKLSTRQTEELVKSYKSPKQVEVPPIQNKVDDVETTYPSNVLEDEEILKPKTQIEQGPSIYEKRDQIYSFQLKFHKFLVQTQESLIDRIIEVDEGQIEETIDLIDKSIEQMKWMRTKLAKALEPKEGKVIELRRMGG